MVWSSILVALLLAIVVTLLVVGLLGWRRPMAPTSESVVVSALFFFAILFLLTWAVGTWIAPAGPIAWGVPWLGWLLIAVVAALLLGAASSQSWGRRPSADAATPGEVTARGFGVMFWALMVALLVAAVIGSTRA